MFCTECGTKIEDGSLFCPNCGAKLAAATPEPAEAEKPAEVPAEKPAEVPAEVPAEKPQEAVAPAPVAPTPVAPEPTPAPAPTEPATSATPAVPATEAPKKKSGKWIILAACVVLVAVLAVVGVVVFGGKSGNKYDKQIATAEKYFDEKEYEKAAEAYLAAIKMDPSQEDAYKSLADVYVKMGDYEAAIECLEEGYSETESKSLQKKIDKVKELAKKDGGETEPTETEPEETDVIVASTEVIEPTPKPEPVFDPQEALLEQKSTVARTYGELNLKGLSYEAPYVNLGDPYEPVSQFDPSVSGVAFSGIYDLDGDGDEELLVILVEACNLKYQVYEVVDEKVILRASALAFQADEEHPVLGNVDVNYIEFYLKEYNGKSYVIAKSFQGNTWFSSMYGVGLEIVGYDGKNLNAEYEVYRAGTDGEAFLATEDEIQALKDHGLTETAAWWDSTWQDFDENDELEELLYVRAFPADWADGFSGYDPELANTEDLESVLYYFYEKQDYVLRYCCVGDPWITRNDHGIKNEDGEDEIVCYCDHVKFFSDDVALANWLNAKLEDAVKTYDFEEVEEVLQAEYENKKESPYPDEIWSYQPLSIVSAYCEDYYVSVGYEWYWFMGGVSNMGGFGVNYDLVNREVLYLEDVLYEDEDVVREEVLEGIAKFCGSDDPSMFEDALDAYLAANGYLYPFWFDEDNIYLMFESYSLNQGSGCITFSIPR